MSINSRWQSFHEEQKRLIGYLTEELIILRSKAGLSQGDLAYDLFWLMMDWGSRNALGITPLKAAVDKIEAIAVIDGLNAYFLEEPRPLGILRLQVKGGRCCVRYTIHFQE